MASKQKSKVVLGGVNKLNAQTVQTTWDDMTAAGMSRSDVEEKYKDKFKEDPDEVHLNDDFCKDYDWLSYNQIGKTTFSDVSIRTMTNTSGYRTLENNTDTSFTHTVNIETTVTDSATTKVTNSSAFSMGSSFTIGCEELGLGTEFSQSFTMSNEVESSSSQSLVVKISDTVQVAVPPHSKISVYLQVGWTVKEEDFQIPVTIDPYGKTGAQFEDTVQGHYHWSAHHADFFTPPFLSTLKGTVKAAYDSTGKVVVEPALALT